MQTQTFPKKIAWAGQLITIQNQEQEEKLANDFMELYCQGVLDLDTICEV